MANNEMNNSRISNRQPSLREQANARMRAAAGKPDKPAAPKASTSQPKAPVKSSEPARKPVQKSSSTGQNPVKKPTQTTVKPQTSTQRTNSERPVRSSANTSEQAVRKEAPTQRSSQQAKPTQQTRTSQQTRNAQNDRSSQQSRPVPKQRPAAQDVIRSEREREKVRTSSRNTASKEKSKGIPKFPIFLALYTALLLVLAALFLTYTDKSLKKYEKSQSEYYMAEYLKTFEENAKNGSFSDNDFSFSAIDLTFVDSSVFMNDYLDSLKSISSFSFEKDPNSYNTEAPIYNIFGDGNPVAQVKLEAVSQSKLLAILTVMDWGVDSISPICSINVTNYSFLIPANYTAVIDGTPVALSYQTGETFEIEEFANIAEYISAPKLVEYKVENVLEDSTIKILNEAGEEMPFTQNGNTITAKYSVANAEMSEDRRNMSLQMVQTYEDFNTDDLSGPTHGLATAQALFIKDSLYWNMAKQWATGVDITFTSAHRFDDPKYSNVVVDNYMEYSDTCYSVHIAFTKNMVFTRREGKFSNEFDSTVYFVKYDDTDDDVNNPQWYIADIIATTN